MTVWVLHWHERRKNRGWIFLGTYESSLAACEAADRVQAADPSISDDDLLIQPSFVLGR